MLTIEIDPVAVEERLGSGELACPGCSAVLVGWGYARGRQVRDTDGGLWIVPRRSRCTGCGATHVLLPVVLLVRRADSAAVIGAGLTAKATGDPTPGALVVDVNGVPVRGEYLVVEPPRRVVFTWGVAGHDSLRPGSTTVEIRLRPDGAATVVELAHRDLPEDQLEQHDVGWATSWPGWPSPVPAATPVGFHNSATAADQRFQAADSYWLIKPPRIGRRRILPRTGSGTGASGRGGRSCSAR